MFLGKENFMTDSKYYFELGQTDYRLEAVQRI